MPFNWLVLHLDDVDNGSTEAAEEENGFDNEQIGDLDPTEIDYDRVVKEHRLLSKEVKCLNQEMSAALNRAKSAELGK